MESDQREREKTCSTLAPEATSSIPTRFDEFDEKRERKRYVSRTKLMLEEWRFILRGPPSP
jgi:hypothetical protein